jgi:hypothetical protein
MVCLLSSMSRRTVLRIAVLWDGPAFTVLLACYCSRRARLGPLLGCGKAMFL